MMITIRPLTPDDWQAFAHIRLEALKNHPDVFGSNYAKEAAYTPDQWQDWLSQKDGCMFGLYDGENMIGLTGLVTDRDDPSGKAGLMIASYIKAAYRRQGLARILYQARIAWAKAHAPWKRLVIGHREGNEPSRRANQRWGFRFTHKKGKTWPDGTAADEYSYELDLEGLRKKQ